MTTFKCRTCGGCWTEGPTRDMKHDAQCRRCVGDDLANISLKCDDLKAQLEALMDRLRAVLPEDWDPVAYVKYLQRKSENQKREYENAQVQLAVARKALEWLYAVARVDRDEDYAAVANAASVLSQLPNITMETIKRQILVDAVGRLDAAPDPVGESQFVRYTVPHERWAALWTAVLRDDATAVMADIKRRTLQEAWQRVKGSYDPDSNAISEGEYSLRSLIFGPYAEEEGA